MARKKHWWILPAALLLLIAAALLVFALSYYRAGDQALPALRSDSVTVEETAFGWRFDGPSTERALIFYPGARVDAASYAPLLHRLAEEGVDVFLVEMPLHFALFGEDRADAIMAQYDYARWYIGGHSLGGAMAASYASKHGEALKGVILCAAYPTSELDDDLTEILLYGSEDQVVNLEKIEAGEQYAPTDYTETVIAGGNHAQFGSYGFQKGDGTASISAEQQWEEAAELITSHTIY